MNKVPQDTIFFNYKFKFSNNEIKDFNIILNKQTLEFISSKKSSPEWTKLKNQQCCNCPLTEAQNEYCPIAFNIVEPIEFFSNSISSQKVDLIVETDQRTYSKNCDLKSAISSLIGIYMVTSGCPIMNKLRPMVKFHLPFASVEETMYRTSTMYLLAQYFLSKKGKTADWKMKDLSDIYEDINIVNFGFLQRLKQIKVENASLNAIIGLDYFGQNISSSLKAEKTKAIMQEIEDLFTSYYL